LGFEAHSLGVKGLGVRVHSSGFMVQGVRFIFQGSGFRVQDSGRWVIQLRVSCLDLWSLRFTV
jgi:hypothetical protein